MVLTLYKTDIRPEMNAVIEDFDKYMTDEYRLVHQWQNVKYTKPDLDIMIKLPLDGHTNSLGEFDYAILYDPDTKRDYYYFVVNMDWKAKMTLRLQLSMDTLNTFWAEIQSSLGKQTHVTRKYYDRWKKVGANIYPLIDNHPEDITQPYMRRSQSVYTVGPTEHWTLVYITSETSTEQSLKDEPVSCLALPDTSKKIDGAIKSNVIDYSTFPDKTVCVLDYAHAPNATIKWGNNAIALDEDGAKAAFGFDWGAKKIMLRWWKSSTKWQSIATADPMTIDGASVLYKQPAGFAIDTPDGYWQFNDPVQISGATLLSFSEWFESHKTDSRLVKIIELPYAPFEVEYASTGKFKTPMGWEMTGEGALKLKLGTIKFASHVFKYDSLGPQSIAASTIRATEPANPLVYETKLWNSNYYTYKFIYDNNAHIVKLEDFAQPGSKPAYGVDVSFEASTGMDNSIIFKFDSNEVLDSDFGEYLVCNRSTEIQYYTHEYLNYLRYGNAVDEKNKTLSTLSTVVNGVGSGVSTAASLAFALTGAGFKNGGAIGAGIGAGVGLVSMAIATASSISKANDQINAKIDNYTHQASGVSASSDLSVFKAYGKNKLLLTAYEPVYELKESIGRYFELFGYSCDVYGVPNWKTRLWSDYFVMEPVFVQSSMLQPYEEDIATRMQAGFRILHRRTSVADGAPLYDFDNEYENWERSLIA